MVIDTLDEIRRDYIDCTLCPPKRHCCNFSPGYYLYLTPEMANSIIPDGRMSHMIAEHKLIEDEYGLKLQSPCPALTQDMRCNIYNDREEYGFMACVTYPLFTDDYKGQLSYPHVLVDYRCYNIEKHWNDVSGILLDILKFTSGIRIRSRYLQGSTQVKLEEFINRHSEGKIPSQELQDLSCSVL